MSYRPQSRRSFLETAGRIGVGAALAGAVESSRGYAANDTIQVGCIGTGGRCRSLMKPLARVPNVKIVAVCDVWDVALDQGRELADPKAFPTKHFREVLDRKDIDAVLIATPDHWHVPIAVEACRAGKDVYVEKPLTHDPSEGARIVAAQAEHRRIVQVGQQQRSMPHIQKAQKMIQDGRIGRVFKIALSWNRKQDDRMRREPQGVDPKQVNWADFLGIAPDQPFDEYRFRNWRWFWDFGGGILTDLMVHWIDVAHWLADLDHPESAASIGTHVVAKGVWQTPDTIQCLLEYPGGVQAHFEGTFSNSRNASRIEFMGTDGTIYIDRGAMILNPDRDDREELILGSDPHRGRDFYDKPDGELLHLTNWIESVRSRERPNCPAEAGVAAALAAHLGNRAFRTCKVATWDDLGLDRSTRATS